MFAEFTKLLFFYVFTGRYQRGSRSLAYNLANPFSQEQVVYEVTSSLNLSTSFQTYMYLMLVEI